jgi:hypothetical protein
MFLNLWRRIVNHYIRAVRRAHPPVSRPNVSFRPQVEAFEDRTLLATVYWWGGPGLWSDPVHWVEFPTGAQHVPTASDSAVIALDTVTHSEGADAVASVSLLSGGGLALTGGTLASGAFSNAGNVTIEVGSTLTVSGIYTQTAGMGQTRTQTTLNGGTLTSTSLVDIQADTTLAGTGTINGNLRNAGLLTIGDDTTTVGILTINGNFTQTSAGTLAVKVGGLTTAGSDFDQLVLSPGFQATLDGTLQVTLINGYTPTTDDSVMIMTFDSATGTFAHLTGDGPLFMDTYDPTDVTLIAI